jgi:hypothetical protein
MNGFSATASMASKGSHSSFMPGFRNEKIVDITVHYLESRIIRGAVIRIQNLQSLICCATHNC